LRRRPFQPLIGRNLPFPYPENEGGSTITAVFFPKHRMVVVREKGAGKRAWQPAREWGVCDASVKRSLAGTVLGISRGVGGMQSPGGVSGSDYLFLMAG